MGQRTPLVNELKQGTVVARRYLADGGLPDETNPTLVFYSTIRVDWYRWWQRERTRACSLSAMVA